MRQSSASVQFAYLPIRYKFLPQYGFVRLYEYVNFVFKRKNMRKVIIIIIMLGPISIYGVIDEAVIEQAEQVCTLHSLVKNQLYHKPF